MLPKTPLIPGLSPTTEPEAGETAGIGEVSGSATHPSPTAVSLAEMQAHLRAMREAGTLSPEGNRMLAQAEAIEAANREMEGVRRRLEGRLKEIEEEAGRGRRRLQ